MKKKVIISALVVVVISISVYKFAYKSHRDIASEKADYTITVKELQTQFNENNDLSNKKYLDKTIEIYGKITNIDLSSNSVVIDDKIFATFKSKIISTLDAQKSIKIKGRFIGYDDLLEQFKLDEVTIVK